MSGRVIAAGVIRRRDDEVCRARYLAGGCACGDGRGDPLLELLDLESMVLLHGNSPPIRETSLACGLLLRAAVLIGVAVPRRVGGVARRELAGGEVGVRRRDPLLQWLDLETTLLLFFAGFHNATLWKLAVWERDTRWPSEGLPFLRPLLLQVEFQDAATPPFLA